MLLRLAFICKSCAVLLTTLLATTAHAQMINAAGQPAQLNIRKAGENSIRITLKPISFKDDFPFTPAVAEKTYPVPEISLLQLNNTIKKKVGALLVEVRPNPLTIIVTNNKGQLVQNLVLQDDGKLFFKLGDAPVLGMGEGGPKPERGTPWRQQAIQYDRRGRYDSMQPRWQSDAYGSRNPVATLIGTEGWGLFVATPWVEADLREKDKGVFVPWKPVSQQTTPQDQRNQHLNQGKGLPPIDKMVLGLYDFFVFDAHDPTAFLKDYAAITGPAAMPPKWALGYMQSHRTLIDEDQMIGIVDTFRTKKIPVDAVIYLGTGFAPRGWNKRQPSFEFNPDVFHREPKEFFRDMHSRNVKVIVHMVPWDRDKLPTLQGSIPAKAGETLNASHIQQYWQQHTDLVKTGVDAFWPDEGDWFNLFERIKRHQLYYQGQLSSKPNVRSWHLQRNGYPGIAQWGGLGMVG